MDVIPRRRVLWLGLAPIIFLPIATFSLTPTNWARWQMMWLLAFALYLGCKWLSWQQTPSEGVPRWVHAAYLLAWPGLDARRFLQAPRPGRLGSPERFEWIQSLANMAIGAAFFWIVPKAFGFGQEMLIGWLGMIGVILMLHFGSFQVLSCFWRTIGIDASPVMNHPLRSKSLSDFWSKRWNTAFRDFTQRFLFRPLAVRVRPAAALIAGFFFSGLIHDLVISLPAGGGYGWPTLYFVLQALAILLERSAFGRRVGIGRGWRGRLFALLVLTAPLYGLFHPPFVRHVVVPFMKSLGSP